MEQFEVDVARAIETSDRAYGLLIWLGDLVDANKVSVEDARRILGSATGAASFLKRQAASLPSGLKPIDEEAELLTANVLGSYLTVSFDLFDEAQEIGVPDPICGPRCPWCWHVTTGPHLKRKKLSGLDKRRAEAASRSALRALLRYEGTVVDDLTLERLLADCREEAAVLAYAQELIDRASGHDHGTTGLALWRLFAWQGGSPRKDFRLDVVFVEGARTSVMDHLASMTSEISNPRRTSA